jgi:hypothetical protein
VILEKRASFGWPATAAGYANPKSGIAVHFDGNDQGLAGKPHSACRTYWKNTRNFHIGPERKWLDIGYSFGVCPHGVIFEGRGLNHQQAAQPGGNSTWYSCTFMSGKDEKPPTAQLTAFREFRSWLRGKGVAAAMRGHRDFVSTDCPGPILYGMVRDGTLATAPQEEDVELTAANLAQITRAVWETDGAKVPAQYKPGTNTSWAYVSLQWEMYARIAELRAAHDTQMAGLKADIAAIKAAVIPTI